MCEKARHGQHAVSELTPNQLTTCYCFFGAGNNSCIASEELIPFFIPLPEACGMDTYSRKIVN